VTDAYNEKAGVLETQSTTTEGKTHTLTGIQNTLGQPISYTDASGNISTFEYEGEKGQRLTKANDGKGTQTYTYNETNGEISQVTDSTGGTFTGTYDLEGNLLTQGYPNGMTATETYNPIGEPTNLVYKKETHCTENCEWFKDSVIPSIHGQWLSQTSTFGTWSYIYDEIGRLTQVEQTRVGKGCVTRDYSYEEETNRTSLSTYEPNSKGECASESGVIQKHSYDSADRLTDPGTSYEAFGNITSLPAADAGGSELSSTFYVNSQLASQEQAGQRIGYNLDPAGRINETISTGKIVNTVTNHYASPSTEPAWTSEISGQYKRNIPGINGELAAIQTNEETPILQVVNLQGDIVATANKSETASGLASTIAEPSEYGVPATETPPKYSWLGAHELPTELPSGVVDMGARSYVPEIGRFLQTDPVPGGSANLYAYTYGDPINSTDLSGELTENRPTSGLAELSAQTSAEAAAEQAAINAAARAEAERKVAEAAERAARWAAMEDSTAEEYEEE
jgi:RHS repeat-associated protein